MILIIYNKQICREVLLPNLFEADYRLPLSRNEYHLRRDLDLHLENTQKKHTGSISRAATEGMNSQTARSSV